MCLWCKRKHEKCVSRVIVGRAEVSRSVTFHGCPVPLSEPNSTGSQCREAFEGAEKCTTPEYILWNIVRYIVKICYSVGDWLCICVFVLCIDMYDSGPGGLCICVSVYLCICVFVYLCICTVYRHVWKWARWADCLNLTTILCLN